MLKFFESQVSSVLQIHLLVCELHQQIGEHRATKETLAFQLGKLQKDMKEVQALGQQVAKLKEQLESKDQEKLTLLKQV
jgi:hypothetical protein